MGWRFAARLGAELRAWWEAAGWSADQMARLAGVSDQAILNLEPGVVGKNGPCLGTVIRLWVPLRIVVLELVLAAA